VDCEQALNLISARLDGELSPRECSALEVHLAACSSCRATAEAFALQDADLRQAFTDRRRAAAATGQRIASRNPAFDMPQRRGARRLRRRLLAFVVGLAAAVELVLIFNKWPKTPPPMTMPAPVVATPLGNAEPVLERLVPRPLAPAPAPAVLAAGESVETKAGERRCVALWAGGQVFLDQKSRARMDGPGEVTLEAGAICCNGSKITVKTPDRTIALDEGRLGVRLEANLSRVSVANGMAVVFPHERLAAGIPPPSLARGWMLPPGEWQPEPAPRASVEFDWTRDLIASSEAPLVPASSYAGGALVAVDANGQEAKLSLRKFHVDVYIEDGFARTTIDQTYFNHYAWRLEGTFYFPLPQDASLSRLAMYVDGKLMEGGMAERDYARTVYERIVTSQRDPALLEWVDGSTFKMRVFPLEGRQEKRIILSYTQRLPESYGKMTYRFPAGHSLQVVRDWSFQARVKSGAGLRWASPNNPSVQGVADGGDLLLSDREANVKVDRDIALELQSDEQRHFAEKTRFSRAELDGAHYLMLRYLPDLSTAPATLAQRNWVFVYEASADRDPLLARAQIEIIRQLLSGAGPGDTFDVVTAGTRTHRFAPAPKPVTPENVSAMADFLSKTHLIGALDLGRAFDEAAGLLQGSDSWLVHVGSGYTTIGVRQEALATHLPAGIHYLGVGVGKRWNRAFMKGTAERTLGHFTQINPDESIAWRAFDLMASLNAPRLTAVNITADGTEGQVRPVFLVESTTVSQGEELCAVARLATDDGRPLFAPGSVTVRGSLEGKPFAVTIPVRDVAAGAGYLPRTWAKLEIDRLLAASADANRKRIVELSKSMYVMSPFTSLLVLENEAMYAQYKVDRGRKDHWAMYPCPQEIPVVYEPDPLHPVDVRNAPRGRKPNVDQVLQTVLFRVPPQLEQLSGEAIKYENAVTAAVRIATALNARNGRRSSDSLARVGQVFIVGGSIKAADKSLLALEALPTVDKYLAREYELLSFNGRTSTPDMGRYGLQGFIDAFDPRKAATDRFEPGLLPRYRASGLYEGSIRIGATQISNEGFAPWEPDADVARADNPLIDKENFDSFRARKRIPGKININSIYDPGSSGDPGLGEPIGTLITDNIPRSRIIRRITGTGEAAPLYKRPQYTNDNRIFSDLTAFAPGLNTTAADVEGILEKEGAPDLSTESGGIDPEARRLIDAARSKGWQSATLSGGKGKPDFVITFDARGRYSYERTTTNGLLERVICNGETLIHLYPELGVGGRRLVTHLHREELGRLLPWLVPSTEDLARGRDVRLVNEHTVAVIPRGANATRALHLVFGEARLEERQIVNILSRRILAREVYDKTGAVRWLDGEDKECRRLRVAISDVKPPDLRPELSGLLVLPLPFRSHEHVFAKYGLNPSIALGKFANEWFATLPESALLELLASALATHNVDNARALFDGPFTPCGERRRGLFTLMAACGLDVTPEPSFQKALIETPDDPLLRYLSNRENAAFELAQRFLPVQSGDAVGHDGFMHRLAVFHDLVRRWQSRPVPGTNEIFRRLDARRTLAFIRENPGSPLSRALLSHAQDNLDDELKWLALDLAKARGILAEQGGEYSDGYEQARLLFQGGHQPEAARRFRELYQQGLKAGDLPSFDSVFRDALHQGDAWGKLMNETAIGLVKARQRPRVVALAWQCSQVGDPTLAEYLLAISLDGVPEDEQLETSLAALEYLHSVGETARSEQLLHVLIGKERSAKDARLWRLREANATSAQRQDDAISYLEHALDLEYHDLPAVIDLESWRSDYGRVLDHCARLAAATKSLGAKPPADLQFRTIRTADRWRAHDPETARICTQAAAVLADLGEAELAWDYLASATASEATDDTAWRQLAVSRHSNGDLATAERAYAAACAAAPEDALLVWDRAINLRDVGQSAEADKLFHRLAEGDWPAKYADVRQRARWQLGDR
jgi:hypothetical protein